MIIGWLKLRVAGLISGLIFKWGVENLTSCELVFSSPALVICDLFLGVVHEVCLGCHFSTSVLLSDANRCHLLSNIAILPCSSLIAIVINFARKHLFSFVEPMEHSLRGIGIAGRLHLLLSR